MGPLNQILGMLPGVDTKALKGVDLDDKQFARTVAIIQSMTKQERNNPNILNAKRRIRIANGSGMTVTDVNRLLKQFEDMKNMMKQFSGGNAKKMMKGMGGFNRPF